MHVLFDIGHPAHVHLFRHTAHALLARGDKVTITIRDRGIIGQLLDAYELPYAVASSPRRGLLGNALELLEHNWYVLKKCLVDRPDYLIGTSVSVAHVGRLVGRRSVVLNEDDADYVPLFAAITYPFANRIVIPSMLRDKKGRKHLVHDSYHELAYLHPDNFVASSESLSFLGLNLGDPFFIIRLVALSAHHDGSAVGLSVDQVEMLIEELEPHGRVFVNAEGELSDRLKSHAFTAPPEHMHSILAQCRMLISDSQTMTIEAAVLGRPAIRCNTFVGQCSVIEELEERWELAWGFQPSQFAEMFQEIRDLLADSDLDAVMAARRDKMLIERTNLSAWLIEKLDAGQL